MALGSEYILRIARHFPLLRYLFRSDAHAIGNTDVFVISEYTLVGNNLVPTHRNQTHALGTRADHDVSLTEANAIGGNGDRVKPRRAKPVDRNTGH